MGTYCSILFDEMEVCSRKSVVPDEYCALFQEGDRHSNAESRTDEDDELKVFYRASRSVVLSRLELLGCSEEVAKHRFDKWRQQRIDDGDEEWSTNERKLLRGLTFDEWKRRVPQVLASRYRFDGQPLDEIDEYMKSWDDSWLWFDGYASLVSLRALLDACRRAATVTLDLAGFVSGEYIRSDAAVCAERRRDIAAGLRPLAPTVILAEGPSDIRVLRASLEVLFPERRDYFSFFDFEEMKVDGGANYLVKFLKAFASARAPLRIVAIFDNDTAGGKAFGEARRLKLPSNFALLQLPDTTIASTYPTVGPEGRHVANVNGKAASIELYLGRSSLTYQKRLRPVRWTGYDHQLRAYHGEVEGKAEVQSSFMSMASRQRSAVQARRKFPELVQVWTSIFDATSAMTASVQKALPPWDSWTLSYR